MTDRLTDEARDLLAAARAAEPPLEADRRSRMRTSLLSSVTAGAAGVGAASTAHAAGAGVGASVAPAAAGAVKSVTFAMIVKATGVIAVVGGLVTAAAWRPEPPTAPPTDAATDTVSQPLAAPSQSPVLEGPPPAEPTPERTAAVPTAVATPEPTTTPSIASARPQASALGRRNDAPGSTATQPSDEEFLQELARLDRARASLAAGDPTGALRELDTAPPNPAFTEERRALHIVATCAAGRREEGRRELDAFRRVFPRSLQTKRVSHACD